jgi:hypothetical protein
MHDESVYPRPSEFDPNRFIPAEGRECQPDPTAAFGFGYRVCPGAVPQSPLRTSLISAPIGAHFAQTSILILVSCTLAAFCIRKALDEAGQEVEPEIEYTTGITRQALL